jgi:dihydropyrimidinase
VVAGADADLVVWDPAATHTIRQKTHHSKLDVNVFEGIAVTGVPAVTLSQGKVVWKNGQLDVQRGAGRYVPRPPMAPMFEAQSKWNELTRPQGVKRQPAVHQTP